MTARTLRGPRVSQKEFDWVREYDARQCESWTDVGSCAQRVYSQNIGFDIKSCRGGAMGPVWDSS